MSDQSYRDKDCPDCYGKGYIVPIWNNSMYIACERCRRNKQLSLAGAKSSTENAQTRI